MLFKGVFTGSLNRSLASVSDRSLTRREFCIKLGQVGVLSQCGVTISSQASLTANLYRLQVELNNPTGDFIPNPVFEMYLPMTIASRQQVVDVTADCDFKTDKLASGHQVLTVSLAQIEPWNTVILNVVVRLAVQDLGLSAISATDISTMNKVMNKVFYQVAEPDRRLLQDTAMLLKAKSAQATLKNTFEWVGEHIQRSNYNAGFLTVDKLWATKLGDCSEFSLLTSELLRLNGFASRNMAGFLLGNDTRLSMGYYHNWCECLFNNSWVIVDSYTQTLAVSAVSHIATQVYEIDDTSIHHAKFLVSEGVKVRI